MMVRLQSLALCVRGLADDKAPGYTILIPGVVAVRHRLDVDCCGAGVCVTTTIKAVAAAVGDYAEGIASYELTVTAKAVTPTVTVPGTYTYTGSAQTPDGDAPAAS